MTIRLMGGPVSAGGMFPPWLPGRSYSSPPSPGYTGNTQFNAGYGWYVPIYVPNPCVITKFSFWGFASASATTVFRVFADDPTATSFGPAASVFNVPGINMSTTTGAWVYSTTYTASTLSIAYPQILWACWFSGASLTLGSVNYAGSTNFAHNTPGLQSSTGGVAVLRTTSTISSMPGSSTSTAMTIQSATAAPMVWCTV